MTTRNKQTQNLQERAPLRPQPIARSLGGLSIKRNLIIEVVDNGFVVSYDSPVGPVRLVATGEQELHEVVSKWYQSLTKED